MDILSGLTKPISFAKPPSSSLSTKVGRLPSEARGVRKKNPGTRAGISKLQ
jgi:hypothetical protein